MLEVLPNKPAIEHLYLTFQEHQRYPSYGYFYYALPSNLLRRSRDYILLLRVSAAQCVSFLSVYFSSMEIFVGSSHPDPAFIGYPHPPSVKQDVIARGYAWHVQINSLSSTAQLPHSMGARLNNLSVLLAGRIPL